MNQSSNLLGKIFGVVARGQTYLNLIYLALAFPLGLLYFLFLTIGFVAGIPLIIVCVGLFLIPLTVAAWIAFVAIERQLAIWLLRVKIPPLVARNLDGRPAGEQILAYLTSTAVWKGLVYLFLKLPLGVITFVITVFFGSLTLVFLTAPLTFFWAPVQINPTYDIVWSIDTLGEALLVFPIGVVLVFVSLHLFNTLAWGWGWLSKIMLGDYRKPAGSAMSPPAPAPVTPPVQPGPPNEPLPPASDVEIPAAQTLVAAAMMPAPEQNLPPEPFPALEAPEKDEPLSPGPDAEASADQTLVTGAVEPDPEQSPPLEPLSEDESSEEDEPQA